MSKAVPSLPVMTGKRYFSPAERAQLVVLLDAIWPGGDGRPGAQEAGAADYVDQLLALSTSTYYEIQRWQDRYEMMLPVLADAARQKFGSELAELERKQATELLIALSAGSLSGNASLADQKSFFLILRGHCIEGCVADPRWGGNRGGVIWRWLGYPDGGAQDEPNTQTVPA